MRKPVITRSPPDVACDVRRKASPRHRLGPRHPDGYRLDNFYLSRLGAEEAQLDLFGDYKSNVALYPAFQAYFRTHKPPILAVWGKNDPFFLPPGAEAVKRDIPDATVRFFDTGHFALETHADEIAAVIGDFLSR